MDLFSNKKSTNILVKYGDRDAPFVPIPLTMPNNSFAGCNPINGFLSKVVGRIAA